jgi:hypothetical protein
VELLQYLKKLIYSEGYTIEGAKKRLSAEKAAKKKPKTEIAAEHEEIINQPEEKDIIQIAKAELKDILELLNKS